MIKVNLKRKMTKPRTFSAADRAERKVLSHLTKITIKAHTVLFETKTKKKDKMLTEIDLLSLSMRISLPLMKTKKKRRRSLNRNTAKLLKAASNKNNLPV
jgi:hypothetical protein